MAASGAAALLASAVLVLLPVLGGAFLSPHEYATWALVATSSTVALVVDFGGPAYAARESARGGLTKATLARACALTAGGSALVGLLAVLAWPAYSARSDFAYAGWRGCALFATAATGSALRGVLVVLASAFLATGRHRARGALLFGQAAAQAAVATALLRQGFGVWALPVSACASSALALPPAWALLRSQVQAAGLPPTSLRSFALPKGGLSLLGLSLTQLDRWAVGAVATPSFLSGYDMLVRLGSMPRVAVIGLSGVLVVDGARAGSSEERARVHVRALQVVAGVVLALSAGVVVVTLVLRAVGVLDLDRGEVALLLAVLTWYGLNALTAPTSLLLTGAGHPSFELRYVVPAFACTAMCWTAGLALSSPLMMVVGGGVSLGLWSCWFLWAGHSWFCTEGGDDDTAQPRGQAHAALPGT